MTSGIGFYMAVLHSAGSWHVTRKQKKTSALGEPTHDRARIRVLPMEIFLAPLCSILSGSIKVYMVKSQLGMRSPV